MLQLLAVRRAARRPAQFSISSCLSSETLKIPPRAEMLQKAKVMSDCDLLVVGGGATGSAAALDAAKRGLKVVCIEREDFGSATSSRSTKLLWGGSRYLVEAFVSLFNFDLRLIRSPIQTTRRFLDEFRMVLNCHRERTFMMKNQPHLTGWVPIAVPINRWLIWPPPFAYPPAALGPVGLFPLFFKFYDALSGFQCPPSHIMSRARAQRKFPQLANNLLKYCSVFYEGMHDDARTNLAVAQTAAREGAAMLSYCDAVEFLRDKEGGRVVGARVQDQLTNGAFEIRSKAVLFCGGPFTDELRRMEQPDCSSAVVGAAGIHIVLPSYFAPSGIGLVDMSTSDGRFLFYLPWNDHVIVGTTDHKCTPTARPVPPEEEICWLLREASKYLAPEVQLRRRDVLSAWSGIRPLASDPHQTDSTAKSSRDHVVSYNPSSGVVFVTGGKWTTFREMAEDAIDKVIDSHAELKCRIASGSITACSTLAAHFVGFSGYHQNLAVRLVQEYDITSSVANRLARAYGGRARDVLQIAAAERKDGYGFDLLLREFPILEAEVIFSVRHDWTCRPEDFLARRTRLLFVNKEAALRALPRVVDIMASELEWSDEIKQAALDRAVSYAEHFGGPTPLTLADN